MNISPCLKFCKLSTPITLFIFLLSQSTGFSEAPCEKSGLVSNWVIDLLREEIALNKCQTELDIQTVATAVLGLWLPVLTTSSTHISTGLCKYIFVCG